MKNKRLESLILIMVGIIIMGCGFYIFTFGNTIYPNATSTRVKDLNWILNIFGKNGLAILLCLVGIIPIFMGIKMFQKK